jgi:Ca2+-binding EF-hand superfamily protein
VEIYLLKEQDVKELKEVFDYYDVEKTGMLSPYDLRFLLEDNNFFATKDTLYG